MESKATNKRIVLDTGVKGKGKGKGAGLQSGSSRNFQAPMIKVLNQLARRGPLWKSTKGALHRDRGISKGSRNPLWEPASWANQPEFRTHQCPARTYIQDKRILIWSSNITMVQYINKQRGTSSLKLGHLTMKPFQLSTHNRIWPVSTHIRGKPNAIAISLSRSRKRSHDHCAF